MTFGEMLRLRRKAKGWTLQDLADRASITKSYAWELERDGQNPSLRVAQRIADAFGVKLSTLIVQMERG